MNSNYLWRSKWENQWWALVGKEVFRHAAGDSPLGNLWQMTGQSRSCIHTIRGESFLFCSCILPLLKFWFDLYLLQHLLVAELCFYNPLYHCILPLSPGHIRGQNALQCSQVGQHFPSRLALCVRVLSALFGHQDREISHSVKLKRSYVADKAWAEGAPSPRSCIRLLRLGLHLSTGDIFFSPIIAAPTLSLCTLSSHRLKPSQLCELCSYFLHLSKFLPFCSHPAILNMLRPKSHLYLTLGVWDMLAFPCQCNGFHIHTSKTVKLLSLQLGSVPPSVPSLRKWSLCMPQLCIKG